MRFRLPLHVRLGFGGVALVASTFVNASMVRGDNEWANWRGPNYNGTSSDAKPPIEWSAEKNMQWKTELPGRGSSTPIVWGNQIIILTAEKTDRVASSENANKPAEESNRGPGGRGGPGGGRMSGPPPTNYYRFLVLSYDRKTGKELWRTVATEQVPHEAGHGTNTFASSSPVTDGKRIFAFFGSRGLFALDMQGKKLWEKEFGKQRTRAQFGEGSSPALHGDTLVVPWDHEGGSFIAALNATTGEIKWKVDRDEATTWATPLIVEHKGVTQVITNGKRVRSYNIADGKLIWECGGQTDNPIPTPMLHNDHAIVMTGFRGSAAYSISLDSKGDVSDSKDMVAWKHSEATPYVPSPALYKNQVYFMKGNEGILSSLDVATGNPLIDKKRLNGIQMIYSALGAADNRIYVTGRDGTTLVLEHGNEVKLLATNKLDDVIDSAPVFVGNQLILRGEKCLYSILEQ